MRTNCYAFIYLLVCTALVSVSCTKRPGEIGTTVHNLCPEDQMAIHVCFTRYTVCTGGGHVPSYRKAALVKKNRDHMHMQMQFLALVSHRIMQRAVH